MKALSFLVALYACLSSSEQWTRYPKIYPKFEYEHFHHNFGNNWGQGSPVNSEKLSRGVYLPVFLPPNRTPNLANKLNAQVTATKLSYPLSSNNGNRYLDAKAKQTEDVSNIYSQPIDKNYAGNELLRNNGVQNNLSFNSRRAFDDDVDVKQGVKKVNNYVYFLNKTSTDPLSGHAFTSTFTANIPTQDNLPGSRYLVNENNQNYKESYSIPPRPSWDQRLVPFPPNPVYIDPDVTDLYPDNSNVWNRPDQNSNECYDLVEVIRDLRRLLHKSSISDEKHALKKLFKIINKFVLNNNLQYASFSVVVREIGKVLLYKNDRNSLREDEIIQILQEFKNRDFYHFLLQIRSQPELNIQVVISKLALLLYRLKQVLIQRRYSEESIRLVINRAVQWSVPLVGYYFEKECKIKTQQYIVQNLEVALNVNLEGVRHVASVDELQSDASFENLGNPQDAWYLENSGNLGSLTNLPVEQENQVNLGGLGGLGNLGGLGGLENIGGPVNLVAPGKQAGLANLEGTGNLGLEGLGNQIDLGVLGRPENQALPGVLGNLG